MCNSTVNALYATEPARSHCRIHFTVVSEPPEDMEDGDCEDVGFATVSVRDILRTGRDVVDLDVPSEYTSVTSCRLRV